MLTSTKKNTNILYLTQFHFLPIIIHIILLGGYSILNYFSENLLYYRKKRGMTQNDIARKVFVKHQTISNYEKNTRTCDLNTLVLLSNALDITLDELIKNPHP